MYFDMSFGLFSKSWSFTRHGLMKHQFKSLSALAEAVQRGKNFILKFPFGQIPVQGR